jgi:hypothetical protein
MMKKNWRPIFNAYDCCSILAQDRIPAASEFPNFGVETRDAPEMQLLRDRARCFGYGNSERGRADRVWPAQSSSRSSVTAVLLPLV